MRAPSTAPRQELPTCLSCVQGATDCFLLPDPGQQTAPFVVYIVYVAVVSCVVTSATDTAAGARFDVVTDVERRLVAPCHASTPSHLRAAVVQTNRHAADKKQARGKRTCFTPGSSKSLLRPGVWRATMMTCGMKLPNRLRNPKACGEGEGQAGKSQDRKSRPPSSMLPAAARPDLSTAIRSTWACVCLS